MLPGLKHCRMLKMDGQYDEASRAFVYFINSYEGADKDIVTEIVQDEIRGCELAMVMLEKESNQVTFNHLSSNVNSKAADFAPVPFSDDILYYTSNMVGATKMYFSQRNGEVWSRSRVPKNFPDIFASHYGNGTFAPDNKSFYYTQCDQAFRRTSGVRLTEAPRRAAPCAHSSTSTRRCPRACCRGDRGADPSERRNGALLCAHRRVNDGGASRD